MGPQTCSLLRVAGTGPADAALLLLLLLSGRGSRALGCLPSGRPVGGRGSALHPLLGSARQRRSEACREVKASGPVKISRSLRLVSHHLVFSLLLLGPLLSSPLLSRPRGEGSVCLGRLWSSNDDLRVECRTSSGGPLTTSNTNNKQLKRRFTRIHAAEEIWR